jgi:hypothetical protein
MVFTEIKERNKRLYYYRVISFREDSKIKKKRIYLGTGLTKDELSYKEREADKSILSEKIEKSLEKIKPIIIKILKKYKIERAGIFGSYAHGEERKNSDIDILISHPKSPKGQGFGFVSIGYELESVLKKKVDLVTYKSLSPYLKERILNEEIRIL